MHLQLDCPCCGARALNPSDKLRLTIRSTRPCSACGAALGLGRIGAHWFLLGWVPISLSGLFPLPEKLIVGSLGITLIFASYLIITPLIHKTGVVERKLPKWILAWLGIVVAMIFAGDWISFIPSTQTRIFALFASAALTLPIMRAIWARTPKADEKLLALGAGALFIVGLQYFALSTVPPALLSQIWGEPSAANATVFDKQHSNKLTRCANKARLTLLGEEEKREICLSEDNWKQVSRGGTIVVKIRKTPLGRLLTGIEPIFIDHGLTKQKNTSV